MMMMKNIMMMMMMNNIMKMESIIMMRKTREMRKNSRCAFPFLKVVGPLHNVPTPRLLVSVKCHTMVADVEIWFALVAKGNVGASTCISFLVLVL